MSFHEIIPVWGVGPVCVGCGDFVFFRKIPMGGVLCGPCVGCGDFDFSRKKTLWGCVMCGPYVCCVGTLFFSGKIPMGVCGVWALCVGCGDFEFFQKNPYRGVGPCVWGVGTLIFFEKKSL